jgi:hypothetical protein
LFFFLNCGKKTGSQFMETTFQCRLHSTPIR